MTTSTIPPARRFTSFGPRLLFVSLLTAIFPSVCTAQKPVGQMHVIMVGDFASHLGVEADFNRWIEEFNRIERYTGSKPSVVKIVESNYRIEAVRKAIEELRVGADDTVLFYYGGHGATINSEEATKDVARNPHKYNIEAAMKYPALRNLNPENRTEGLKLIDIYLSLFDKHPRLLLVIADCCDNWKPGITTSTALPLGTAADANAARLRTDKTDEKDWTVEIFTNFLAQRQEAPDFTELALKLNYRRLYFEEQGAYVISGAKVGQRSNGLEESGGTFSNTLMALLKQMVVARAPNATSSCSWKLLFMGLCSSPLHTPYPERDDLLQTAQWDRAPTTREGRPTSWTAKSGFNVMNLTEEEFKALVGQYQLPNQPFIVSHKPQRLYFQVSPAAPAMALEQTEKDTFQYRKQGSELPDFTVKFVKGQDGSVEKAVITQNGTSFDAPRIE